jgi:hypothetical protein
MARSRGQTRQNQDRDRPRDADIPQFDLEGDEEREDLFGARLNEDLEEVLTLEDDPLDGFLTGDDT